MTTTINASTSAGLVQTADTSGSLALQTANTTAVTIDTSQNVGIGTASPSTKLAVVQNQNGASQVSISNNTGGASSQALFSATDGTNYGQFGMWGSGVSASGAQQPSNAYVYGSGGVSYFTGGTHRWYYNTNTEAMRIDSSGNVGIGTSSPSYRIDAVGTGTASTGIMRISSNFTNSNIKYGYYTVGHYTNATAPFGFIQGESNSTDNNVHIGGGAGEVTAATRIDFYTASNNTTTVGTERMRITSSGYLKASNTGSYNNVGSSTHEFNNNVSNDYAFYVGATNASYAGDGLTTSFTQRTAANSFAAWKVYTSGGNTLAYLRGDGNAYTDGTWNNNGADYAEFFESANGQALTLGATVVLDGNKVREATDQDDVKNIIGVVRPKEPSKASMIVGNTAWNKWSNKYLSDDFDRYIMEDHDVVEWTDEDGKTHSYESQNIPPVVTVPNDATRKTHDENGVKFQHYKINPEWNPDAEYVNRENRPEWNIIGLLGQVKLLKGKPVGDRWIKMRDVSDSVEEWFIR